MLALCIIGIFAVLIFIGVCCIGEELLIKWLDESEQTDDK